MLSNRCAQWLLIGLALLLAFAPFTRASAEGGQPPIHIPLPFESPMTLTGACPFDVLVEATMDKGHLTIFTKTDTTRAILSGVLKLKVSNPANGKFIEWVNAGPCTFVNNSDGSGSTTCHGPFSWWTPAQDLPPFAFIKGTYAYNYNAANQITDFKLAGNVLDVCDVLK